MSENTGSFLIGVMIVILGCTVTAYILYQHQTISTEYVSSERLIIDQDCLVGQHSEVQLTSSGFGGVDLGGGLSVRNVDDYGTERVEVNRKTFRVQRRSGEIELEHFDEVLRNLTGCTQ